MKNYFIISLCFFFFINRAQTVEPDLEYYNSGQLKWKGQKQCITVKDDKECKPVGFWVHYYKNGEKKMETFDYIYKNNTNAPTRYINMWQQDGLQILKNGIGFYFEKENRGGGEYDSSAYQIKDSLWNGLFFHYRKHGVSNYYLIETGQFSDAKRYGTFKFRDTVKLFEEETVYDVKESSTYKYFHPNFKLKEEGRSENGKKEGLGKFYNDKGILIMEVNYKNGSEFGDYKEYHENGSIKVKGQYKHTSGFVTDSTFDKTGK